MKSKADYHYWGHLLRILHIFTIPPVPQGLNAWRQRRSVFSSLTLLGDRALPVVPSLVANRLIGSPGSRTPSLKIRLATHSDHLQAGTADDRPELSRHGGGAADERVGEIE
jgi:hypothetical protein